MWIEYFERANIPGVENELTDRPTLRKLDGAYEYMNIALWYWRE